MAEKLISHAIGLKEAASLKDPFAAHMAAADKEEMLELDKEVDQELSSPRPEHDKLDKLLAMQSSLGKHAHVQCTPEDGMWREEMDEAVKSMEQRA